MPRKLKTHCNRGHEFTEENTGRHRGGYRYCKQCRALTDKPRHRNSRLVKAYGITQLDYEEMFRRQGFSCPICKTSAPKHGWHVDHCHQTGKVRGILCFNCNTGLGHFKDNFETMINAAFYIKKGGA